MLDITNTVVSRYANHDVDWWVATIAHKRMLPTRSSPRASSIGIADESPESTEGNFHLPACSDSALNFAEVADCIIEQLKDCAGSANPMQCFGTPISFTACLAYIMEYHTVGGLAHGILQRVIVNRIKRIHTVLYTQDAYA